VVSEEGQRTKDEGLRTVGDLAEEPAFEVKRWQEVRVVMGVLVLCVDVEDDGKHTHRRSPYRKLLVREDVEMTGRWETVMGMVAERAFDPRPVIESALARAYERQVADEELEEGEDGFDDDGVEGAGGGVDD